MKDVGFLALFGLAFWLNFNENFDFILVATSIEPTSNWQTMRENIYGKWNEARHDERIFEQGPAAHRLYGGRMNDARRQEAVMITRDAMAKLHKALDTMPAEADEETDPTGLKSKYQLYPHQKQGN